MHPTSYFFKLHEDFYEKSVGMHLSVSYSTDQQKVSGSCCRSSPRLTTFLSADAMRAIHGCYVGDPCPGVSAEANTWAKAINLWAWSSCLKVRS